MIDLQKLQQEIYDNKIAKNFNVTDVHLEFGYTYSELSEAFDAYINKKSDIGEELADVVIYLLGLSQILGVNLEDELLKKTEKNKRREYTQLDGVNTRTKEG